MGEDEDFCTRVEKDLYYLLTPTLPSLSRARSEPAALGKLADAVSLLKERGKPGGDINFCLCRYLVLMTRIHESPEYETKIQWIQERLEGVRLLVLSEALDVDIGEYSDVRASILSFPRRRLGILNCVEFELYLRFAVDYEEDKRKENKDIWE